MKTYLPLLYFFLLLNAQTYGVEISGNAKTFPKTGLIELHGKEILLHGIQIISQNATCQDSNGQWSCGKAAWRALKNKLESGPVNCSIASEPRNILSYPVEAICMLKKENLSIWLVSRGWALTNKVPNEFLLSQENLANLNNAGIWRDGFIPPVFWRASFKKDSKNCNVCSFRRQSFLRKNQNE